MKLFLEYFFIFFIYSIIGWIVETGYVSIRSKNFINRGFLIGPYCPIYGYGSLGMILYLEQYRNNPITIFILGTVICCILEYFTSYIMEILFKSRWWDYSNRKFNLNGRICGENALLFGLGGIAIIYLIHPNIETVINNMNETALNVISIICLIIFITDTISSLNIMKKLKTSICNIEIKKDSTQEISKMVQDTIKESHKIFQSRLLTAFPNIELKKLTELKEDIKGEIKDLLNK